MNQIIPEIGQDPFGIREAFYADGVFAAFVELLPDLFADGLDLLRIAPAANHEEVGKRRYFAQIEHADVEGLLGFGGSNSSEPWRIGKRRGRGLNGCGALLSNKENSYPYGTLEFPMRQFVTLFLSLGALVLPSLLTAQSAPEPQKEPSVAEIRASRAVALAELELQRITGLVDAGALPRIRVQQAEADLADAKDEAILEFSLYGELPAKGASDEVSTEMVAAAQRRVDRQQARVEKAREIVSAGVAAQSYLLPLQQELTLRQTSLDLAQLRARLIAEIAASNAALKIPDVPEATVDDADLFAQGMEHYEGGGTFDEKRDLAPLQFAFEGKFIRPLPISADGETDLHRALGFDHRGRVDVAVDPNCAEGVWLRQYLKLRKIPYYAFTHAIPGKATAAHIHIGPGSTRLSSRFNPRVSSKVSAHAHSAD